MKAIREAAGLGFREMREALLRDARFEVSHSALSKYEKGTKVPAEVAAALVEASGVSPGWLLSGKGPVFDLPPHQAAKTLARMRELIEEHEDVNGPE